MNPEQLEEILAQYAAALTRLSILALAQDPYMIKDLFFETTKRLVTYSHLPEPLQARIRVIREERWGIV
jgi:hypothetical protein